MSKVRDNIYPTQQRLGEEDRRAQRETLTIAGFALDGTEWDGLYVARREGDDLVYAGTLTPWIRGSSAPPASRRSGSYAPRTSNKRTWCSINQARRPTAQCMGCDMNSRSSLRADAARTRQVSASSADNAATV
jgi:hypothetical protein